MGLIAPVTFLISLQEKRNSFENRINFDLKDYLLLVKVGTYLLYRGPKFQSG